MLHVIASSKGWHNELPNQLKEITGDEFVLVSEKEGLNKDALIRMAPRYVFFPHWSHIIPPEVFENFECVIFHMTDVPFGRGGSPLQNLISRKIYETKISALRCVKDLDAGPVYMKEPFSLHGSAEEIFLRATQVVKKMIIAIIKEQPEPIEQRGEVVTFKRRTPVESDIAELDELERVFDYIRMLDAEGYPKAFLETKHFRFEFTRASLKHGCIEADVKISRKKEP